MKTVPEKLLADLGFELEEQELNEFVRPENVINMPFKAFHIGNRALEVHISNLIAEYGYEAVIDELVKRGI